MFARLKNHHIKNVYSVI